MKGRRAIKSLTKQLNADPQNVVLRIRLAGALRDAGRGLEAIHEYLKVAQAYETAGRLSQAIAVLQGVLEIDPKHATVAQHLGRLETMRLEVERQEARRQGMPPPQAQPPPRSSRGRNRLRGRPSSAPPEEGSPPDRGRSRTGTGSWRRRHRSSSSIRGFGTGDSDVHATMVGAPPAPFKSGSSVEFSTPKRAETDDETRIAGPSAARVEIVDDEDDPTRIADADLETPTLPPIDQSGDSGDDLLGDEEGSDDRTVVSDSMFTSERGDTDETRAAPDLGVTGRFTTRTRRITSGRIKRPSMRPVDPSLLAPFLPISPSAIEALAEVVSQIEVHSGDMILREGEPGDASFVIARGEVRVLKRPPLDPRGDLIEVARLGEGELFGEFALLGGGRRHASVQAIEDCVLYEITRTQIQSLRRRFDEVGVNLARFYRQRMLDTLMATAPFFEPLSAEQRRELRGLFVQQRIEAGHRIVTEGQRSGGFFLIVLGTVDIHKRGPDQRQLQIASLSEGEYFGEMSLLKGESAGASVVARGPVELAILPAKRFYSLVASHPVLWLEVRNEANRREEETHRIMAGVTASV